MEEHGPKAPTDAERIATLEAENAQLRAVLQRTAAFLGREGAKIGTAGAELNAIIGL